VIGRVQRRRLAAVGWEERAVRPVLVVMAAVDAKDVCEVAASEDEEPVEAVGAE